MESGQQNISCKAVRELNSLPLSKVLIESLQKNGFRSVRDLEGVKPLELMQELKISSEDAMSIIRCVAESVNTQEIPSAKELLLKRTLSKPIITFCKSIDQMMGGGVPIGQITEFCGVPGVGKTQMAMQLVIDVQIPEVLGGNGAEAIYVDTEGSFMVERLADMASAVSTHLSRIAKSKARNRPETLDSAAITAITLAAEGMTKERFLEGVNVYRAHDQSELLAVINRLPAFLAVKTKVKLLVIDSIAFPFRQNLQDNINRSRLLSSVAQQLNQLAYNFGLAVVVINHVTTRFDHRTLASSSTLSSAAAGATASTASSSGIASIIPALGEQWSHCVTNRIMLHWEQGQQRVATIVKSPSWAPSTANYRVCGSGIRDIELATNPGLKRKLEENNSNINSNSRTNNSNNQHPQPSSDVWGQSAR